MAPTHVRIGSFEVFASRGQKNYLRQLADYTIELHFPALVGLDDRHAHLLGTVARRTASLMAQWQAVGFTHGVMNTDNFSITGLTLDYGPYAFMEAFDSGFIPNHSDPDGRYAYDQQPAIGQWNVSALAQAFLPLMPREQAVAAFDAYVPAWEEAYARVMRGKLGLETAQPGDDVVLDELLTLMQAAHADWSITWRALGGITLAGDTDSRAFASQFADRAGCDAWMSRYRARLRAESSDDASRRARMDAVNPKYVLRTWMAHEAITAAQAGDYSVIDRLLLTLRRPFDEQPGNEAWATSAPAGAAAIELSCSS
jgi:uncharacterized protein YdiU (UPF0061 family)